MFFSDTNVIYKAVLSTSGTPMLLVDEETGKILDANDAAAYLYKINRSALDSYNIATLWQDPTILQKLVNNLDNIDEDTHIQHPVVAQHTCVNDIQRILELFPNRVTIDNQHGLFIIIHDITKRVEAERQLTIERIKWQARVEHAHDLTLVLDSHGDIKYISPSWERTLGLDRQAAIGEQIHNFIHADDVHDLTLAIAKIDDPGANTNLDCRVKNDDGDWHWVELHITNKTHIEGIHDYIVNGRSVHERKSMAQEAQRRENLLKISQQIANVGSWQWDVATNEVSWSEETFRIYGYEPYDVDVSFALFMQHCHCEDQQRITTNLKDAMAQNAPFEHFHRIQLNDGSTRIIYGRGMPELNNEGVAIRYYGICHDITEQKHLEKQLIQYTRELENHHHAMEQFTCVASHDLKEPLRKIIAFGDRLKSKYSEDIPSVGQDYIDRMQSASSRMSVLIDDLLAYSKIKGELDFDFVDVNLETVVNGVLGDLELRIEETNATIDKDPLPTIQAEPLRMRQLFQNLLANALKFTVADRPPVITIRAQKYNGTPKGCGDCLLNHMIEIVISDNGVGFDPSMNETLFEPFKRLHGRKKYKGTGMGLAICKTIVERHNGTIEAIGKKGEGATFIIRLPLTHHVPSVTPCG